MFAAGREAESTPLEGSWVLLRGNGCWGSRGRLNFVETRGRIAHRPHNGIQFVIYCTSRRDLFWMKKLMQFWLQLDNGSCSDEQHECKCNFNKFHISLYERINKKYSTSLYANINHKPASFYKCWCKKDHILPFPVTDSISIR